MQRAAAFKPPVRLLMGETSRRKNIGTFLSALKTIPR
jgi:hypothetical protein